MTSVVTSSLAAVVTPPTVIANLLNSSSDVINSNNNNILVPYDVSSGSGGNASSLLISTVANRVLRSLAANVTEAASLNITNGSSTTTETPAPQQPPIPYAPWQQGIVSVILGVLIICTIIGNSLVCMSVAMVKRLQSPSNLLIVSLAVADLCVGLMVMPFAAVFQVYGSWVLGPIVCDLWTTVDVLLCTSSILNLCAISVDRYFVITQPFRYAMKRTPRRMGLMVLFVWSLSSVVCIPPVFGWKSKHVPYMCNISNDLGYQIYATLCAFYLPLFVMIFVYFKIWRVSSKIAKSEAKSKIGSFDKGAEFQLGRPSHDSGDSNLLAASAGNGTAAGVKADGVANGDDDGSIEILPKKPEAEKLSKRRFTIRSILPRHPRNSASKDSKATKTLGIIMGGFTLCWLPFFILALVKTFCPHCSIPPAIDGILWWLGYTNSFLNPVIYARFNREFRTPFKEILLFRCRGINRRMRSESYVEQYGPVASHRDSLRPTTDTVVRYNSQGQTVVAVGNGSANGSRHNTESRI